MRPANPRSSMIILAFFAAPLALAACERPAEEADAPIAIEEAEPETQPEIESADPIAGEYELPSGLRAVVADGSYTVYDGDEAAIEGTYTYDGSIVTFVDHAGPLACEGQSGVYELSEEAGDQTLRLIEDPCDGRRQDITGEADEAEES